jgi:hypothetical protein
VVLTGDLYHFPGERTYGTFPAFELDQAQTAASRATIEELLEETGAELWIHHDLTLFSALRKSPAFYD